MSDPSRKAEYRAGKQARLSPYSIVVKLGSKLDNQDLMGIAFSDLSLVTFDLGVIRESDRYLKRALRSSEEAEATRPKRTLYSPPVSLRTSETTSKLPKAITNKQSS